MDIACSYVATSVRDAAALLRVGVRHDSSEHARLIDECLDKRLPVDQHAVEGKQTDVDLQLLSLGNCQLQVPTPLMEAS